MWVCGYPHTHTHIYTDAHKVNAKLGKVKFVGFYDVATSYHILLYFLELVRVPLSRYYCPRASAFLSASVCVGNCICMYSICYLVLPAIVLII